MNWPKLTIIFLFSLNALANSKAKKKNEDDCGPKPKPKGNVIRVYEECTDKEKHCLTLKDRAWQFYNLLRTQNMIVEIEKASVKLGANSQLILVLKQTKSSACRFEKVTTKNLKKTLYLVVGGEIIAAPEVYSKMSAMIEIPMKKEWPKDELLSFCKWLHKDCSFTGPKKSKKASK
jgi:preprotein translocase subunit SecD